MVYFIFIYEFKNNYMKTLKTYFYNILNYIFCPIPPINFVINRIVIKNAKNDKSKNTTVIVKEKVLYEVKEPKLVLYNINENPEQLLNKFWIQYIIIHNRH